MGTEIAVIGMSGIFPGAESMEQFDYNLRNKVDGIVKIPSNRLNLCSLDPNSIYFERGYLEHIEYFDYDFFGVSKGEASLWDPQQRVLLELACRAIEDAGYSLDGMQGQRMGIILSAGRNQYLEFLEEDSGTAVNGNENGMAAARIADFLGSTGNAYMVDTTCSSSLMAVHQACSELLLGDAVAALAGGVNLQIVPYCLDGVNMNSFGVISSGMRSRPFDQEADGTGIGEGGGVVMLKKLDDALRDGDAVYAVVKGSAVNHSGGRGSTIAAPSWEAQSEVLQAAWDKAGIFPEQIGMLETHGTGTKVGDPIEVQGIEAAFASGNREVPACPLTAVKSNIGHLGMGAGIASFIKTVLSISNKVIYPLANFKQGNELIPWQQTVVYPCDQVVEWKSPERIAGVSSFGLSGTNVHMVLQNPPIQKLSDQKDLSTRQDFAIVTISAKDKNTLCDYAKLCAKAIKAREYPLDDLAFTLNAGRTDYRYRAAFLAGHPMELADQMVHLEDKSVYDSKEGKGVYFLCSGDVKGFARIAASLETVWPAYAKEYRNLQRIHNPPEGLAAFVIQYTAFINSLKICKIPIAGILACKTGNAVIAFMNETYRLDELVKREQEFSQKEFRKDHLLQYIEDKKQNGLFIDFNADGFWGFLKQALQPDAYKSYAESHGGQFLCDLYRSGVSIDWSAFYDGQYQRVHLPAYPFRKEVCWKYPKKPTQQKPEVGNKYTPRETQNVREVVTEIWKSCIGVDHVDLQDDFFEIGGNSIMSLKIIGEINERYGDILEVEDFYDYATVKELADCIEERYDAAENVSAEAIEETFFAITKTSDAYERIAEYCSENKITPMSYLLSCLAFLSYYQKNYQKNSGADKTIEIDIEIRYPGRNQRLLPLHGQERLEVMIWRQGRIWDLVREIFREHMQNLDRASNTEEGRTDGNPGFVVKETRKEIEIMVRRSTSGSGKPADGITECNSDDNRAAGGAAGFERIASNFMQWHDETIESVMRKMEEISKNEYFGD